MKYFLDTEFVEGIQTRPLLLKSRLGDLMVGKAKPTIDLISIGIVAEDGREYYAISKDFNLKEAWNRFDLKDKFEYAWKGGELVATGNKITEKVYWLRENVLYPIFWHLYQKSHPLKSESEYGNLGNFMGWKERKGTGMKEFKNLLQEYGKTNKEIAQEVFEFCHFWNTLDSGRSLQNHPIEFYAYYADYDWVVFCWLFGKMMDLPKGFPMYCKDLKQMMDEISKTPDGLYAIKNQEGYRMIELKEKLSDSKYYPEQENEHSAIDDARWNKKLYEFLKQL